MKIVGIIPARYGSSRFPGKPLALIAGKPNRRSRAAPRPGAKRSRVRNCASADSSARRIAIAPILWRLPSYGIELPVQAQPIVKYMNSIFSRSTFRSCLTTAEREMRH